MKNCIHSLFILILACILLVNILPQTSAETLQTDSDVILGDDSNITGYIVPDEDEDSQDQRVASDQIIFDGPGGGRYTKIFSITASQVSDLLTSAQGSKSFTLSSLPSTASYILCRGTLYHSITDIVHNEDIMRGGICYYGYSSLYQKNMYISVIYKSAEHGVLVEQSYKISDYLESGKTYYTFVKNRYGAGYVYGTWEIYSSAF